MAASEDHVANEGKVSDIVVKKGTDVIMGLLHPVSTQDLGRVHSIRWDDAHRICGDDAISLSVADMDFKAPDPLVQAVVERAQVGDFCYTYLDPSYRQSVCGWFKRRHGWQISPASLVPVGRMVESLPAILREALPPACSVIVPYPAYSPTPTAIKAAGCKVLPWMLKIDGQGKYRFDFDALEDLLDQASAMVITNPHNPTGRVWTRDELAKVAKAAAKHDVLVISDEFHADLIHSGYRFQPYLTSSPEAAGGISFTSPGKTFNIAGLETANIVVPDTDLRHKVEKAIDDAGCHNPRYFAQVATQAGYDHCADWLDELLTEIEKHADLLRDCVAGMDGVKLIEPEGTYLAWIDMRGLGLEDEEIEKRLAEQGLMLDPGTDFGLGGSGFVRINLATTTPILTEALSRMNRALGTSRGKATLQ